MEGQIRSDKYRERKKNIKKKTENKKRMEEQSYRQAIRARE